MIVTNVNTYGLTESMVASGYPMKTETKELQDINLDDIDRAKKLGNTQMGSGHDNFLNGIVVQFDLTFTVKVWTEAERYHFFDFVSSQSTMHCIAKFELTNQYIEYVDERIIAIMEELKDKYNNTKDKEDYLRLLYSNPCGFKLTARMTTNYRQLKTMYNQRKNHRLPEWREFTKWIENLPMFRELCLYERRKMD